MLPANYLLKKRQYKHVLALNNHKRLICHYIKQPNILLYEQNAIYIQSLSAIQFV